MKIIWSPLSIEQVREITFYIALDKSSVAEKWVETIFSAVERLEIFPESGRKVPEVNRDDIREIILGNYRIIYKIELKKIIILIVKSSRQKLSVDELVKK